MLFVGISKLMLNLWFASSHACVNFSLSSVDCLLGKIKPLHTMPRSPRPIKDTLQYWKASEFHSWLLFYSVPILKSVMKKEYYLHWCALVEAIHILLDNSISVDELEKSERLLKYFVFLVTPLYNERYFVFLVTPLYNERYMTLNIYLLHLPDCVHTIGPLFNMLYLSSVVHQH